MLRVLLEDEGHQVIEATDGELALRELEAQAPPELAILDWTMPGLDGPEVCARLRASRPERETYLILLTVKGGRTDTLAGLRSGANDYITKPFDEEALIARVNIGGQMIALQRSLATRVAELVKANEELDAFSRMVAHDLRSPLGAASGFLRLIESDHESSLNPEVRGHLAEIRSVAHQMDQTITDLLDLARATRGELVCAPLNLAQLARDWVGQAGRPAADRPVEFYCPATLPAKGDAGLLRLALQNLLGNAWKFCSRVDRPRVEFRSAEHGGVTVYTIADNGAGFDMSRARNMFAPFQRLHSQSEFEGTGIGLTIVHRVLERHGGTIWAEAESNKGAAFHFTLWQPAPASSRPDTMAVEPAQEVLACP